MGYGIWQIRHQAKADQLTSMIPLAWISERLREDVSCHFVAGLVQNMHVVMRQGLSQPRNGYTMGATDMAQRRILACADNLQGCLIVLMDDTFGIGEESLP
jgi:hypothetical protein